MFKIRKFSILLLLTIILTSCTKTADKSLYEYKHEYMADVSKTSAIINKLDFGKFLKWDHMAFEYPEDKNMLVLYYTSNEDKIAQGQAQNIFNNCVKLFALIHNLDEIKVIINDKEAFYTNKLSIEEEKIFSKKFEDYYTSEEYFYELENQIKDLDKTMFVYENFDI
ncbi:DUF4825 domain-containing protein [Peptoniphilus catoniae]|uniref:DUF4825 domain-containing protein n=1 Tax=Peptoniphilus catoniae TaxID=1660341 RepID=UPI0010FD69E7|nr:DUF4825 domain-containing protein [Peptoniphilus catoniae]